jgi:hypothetical protein
MLFQKFYFYLNPPPPLLQQFAVLTSPPPRPRKACVCATLTVRFNLKYSRVPWLVLALPIHALPLFCNDCFQSQRHYGDMVILIASKYIQLYIDHPVISLQSSAVFCCLTCPIPTSVGLYLWTC